MLPKPGVKPRPLGLKYLAITSEGEFFETPQYLRKAERKLKTGAKASLPPQERQQTPEESGAAISERA